MPVRIYDLAKKLGIESRVVLDEAKKMGIAHAKIPSSTLDKITAECLEEALVKLYPPPASVQVPPATPTSLPPSPQQGKPPGIIIRTISAEVHGIVEQILAGEIPFILEVSRDDGCPPLRAKLVAELPSALPPLRPKPEPAARAELDEHTKRIFRGALLASGASRDGWVNLAEYGSTLKKLDATFQPQDFGEKSLGGLIRRIGIFDIKTDGNTPPVYFIREKTQSTNVQPQSMPERFQEPPQERQHATGKVHNVKLGFGFIAPDDGSENAFFHATEVIGGTIFDLRPGDPVEYEAGVNERGPCAWKVKRLS